MKILLPIFFAILIEWSEVNGLKSQTQTKIDHRYKFKGVKCCKNYIRMR